MQNRLDRAAGCLAGQFCGDAFGAQYEFGSAMTSLSEEMGPSLVWGTAAGQLTDDSEMAVELIRSLISNGKYIAVEAAKNYRNWYHSRPFDIGMTTSAALSGRGKNVESKANGALMRISPLGVFYATHGNDELCADSARNDAAITHSNSVCKEANAVFACTIAHAVSSGDSPHEIYDYMLTQAQKCFEKDVLTAVQAATDTVPSNIAGKSGYVLLALHNAAYRLLNSATVKAAVIETVKIGGDTDTNACIAGALVGACRGIATVPSEWLDTVQNCDTGEGRHVREYQNDVRDIRGLAETILNL